MTCIVGLTHKGKVYIGGDSAGVSGYDIDIRTDPKVFKTGKFIMGFTSSFRMGQLLMCSLKVPKQQPKQKDFDFMVTVFVEAVRKCLKKGGYSYEDKGYQGGTFLVGYKGKLYTIDCDFQVACSAKSYESVGCGDRYAKGALFVLTQSSIKYPETTVRMALLAATEHSAGVAQPFLILNSK